MDSARSSSLQPLMDSVRRGRRHDAVTTPENTQHTRPLNQGSIRSTYSMACLDEQIAQNLDPLLQWASETDLTAENILFLRSVRDFKRKWSMSGKRSDLDNAQLREQFEDAALIWFKLVNPTTARFNINIDYRTFLDLEQIFRKVRYEPFFEEDSLKSVQSDNVIAPWVDSEKSELQFHDDIKTSELDKHYILPITAIHITDGIIASTDAWVFEVPETFTLELFDAAYDIVRTDVFHNTWLRYEESKFLRPPQDGAALQTLSTSAPPCSGRTRRMLCIPLHGCLKALKAMFRHTRSVQPKMFM